MRKLLFILSLLISNVLYSATYYLSPTGSDAAAGGIGTPWKTLEKAWTVLVAGDLLYCRGGTYEFLDMQYLDGLNGTAGNLIKIWAYPGETPVFTEHSSYDLDTEQDLIRLEGDYFHFKGIEIANFEQRSGENAWSAFKCEPTNNSIFEQLNYHHNGSAFKIAGVSTGNLILNCDFHENSNPFAPDAWGGADGLNIGITSNSPTNAVNTIRGCRAWHNSDDGFDGWWHDGYLLIENCWAWDNGYRPGGFTAGGDGGGFKLGETLDEYVGVLKRTIRYCLAIENRNHGIVENNLQADSEVYNNTVVGHGSNGFYYGFWPNSGVGALSNNIEYDNTGNILTNPPITETNNSWQGGLTANSSDFVSVDKSQLEGARLANGDLPIITAFHLIAESDLIGAGTGGLDLGAFPFESAINTSGMFPLRNGKFRIIQH